MATFYRFVEDGAGAEDYTLRRRNNDNRGGVEACGWISLLTGTGTLLVVTGVVLVLIGRRREASEAGQNRFDAFGIKIDVSNPSILLVMFGVVLLLAPRVLPVSGAPERSAEAVVHGDRPDGGDTVAPPPPVVIGAQKAPTPAPPAVGEAAVPAPVPKAAPRSEVTVPGRAVVMQQARPVPSETVTRKSVAPKRRASAAPPSKTLPSRPEVARQVGETPAPAPAAPINPPPVLGIMVVADADSSAGIQVDADTYRRQVRDALLGQVRERLGARAEVRAMRADDLREQVSGEDGVQGLCAASGADRLLVADLQIPFTLGNAVPSAFWPDLRLTAVDCERRRHRLTVSPHLTPHRLDAFPFQRDLQDRVDERWPMLAAIWRL